MRRVLLIFLSLVLVLVGWSVVCADNGFYVIPTMKGKYAPVPKTGQTDSYGVAGSDGDLQKGVAWPIPRFTNNGNGTVTDKLTGLIWMQNANFFGPLTWFGALGVAYSLQSGMDGLTDGSEAGDWRLPNVKELLSLIDYKFYNPALPDQVGLNKHTTGNPFWGVQSSSYWSSTTYANNTLNAWVVDFYSGGVAAGVKSIPQCFVWCVRGGK